MLSGCRSPARGWTSPVAKCRTIGFSISATWLSSMATSTCCPRPLELRSTNADSTPIAVYIPPAMSPIEYPAREGSGSLSCPVVLMSPPIA